MSSMDYFLTFGKSVGVMLHQVPRQHDFVLVFLFLIFHDESLNLCTETGHIRRPIRKTVRFLVSFHPLLILMMSSLYFF